jgi:hypothetical protein
VRNGNGVQQWDRDQPQPVWYLLQLCAAAGRHHFQVRHSLFAQTLSQLRHHAQEIFFAQACSSPEIPAQRVARQVSHLNINMRRRLRYSALPHRDTAIAEQ